MPVLEQNIRGIKRKRPNDKGSEEDKAAELHQKLHHALRELCKVVKKARTFQVQRTLKKLKDARRKDPEGDVTKGLEAQMETLKHLNYDELARSALMTKLKKDKTLSTDPMIQAVAVELPSNPVSLGTPGTPTTKVQSRILSSKILASEVTSIVETLVKFLHSLAGSQGIGVAKDGSRASPNISKKRRIGIGIKEGTFLFNDNAVDPSGEARDEGHQGTSGNEAVAEVDDGWESGTVDALSESDDMRAGAPDDHDSYSEDSREADFPRDDLRKSPHGSKEQSEFLPSLLVGFTRGDSSSEFGDNEANSVDVIRKNRRGQRARRAIWEKKYGKNANHVKKRQQDTGRRKPGSALVDRRSGKGKSSPPLRRTPMQFCAPAYGHERVSRPIMKGSEGVKNWGLTKGQSEPIRWAGGRKQGEQPLHPSWEAKRKQKSAGIVPSQGTKIVFSES